MESIVLALGRKVLPSSLYERLTTSSIAKRLARGSVWSLFGSATARILVLAAMILVARVLGQVSFGELGLIQSTPGMAGLMAGMALASLRLDMFRWTSTAAGKPTDNATVGSINGEFREECIVLTVLSRPPASGICDEGGLIGVAESHAK